MIGFPLVLAATLTAQAAATETSTATPPAASSVAASPAPAQTTAGIPAAEAPAAATSPAASVPPPAAPPAAPGAANPAATDPAPSSPAATPTPTAPVAPAPVATTDEPNSAAPASTPGAAPIIVTAGAGPHADPVAAVNATAFNAVQTGDKVFVRPVTVAYKTVVPSPFRRALHNFFANLSEPVVALNFVLQHKLGKASETIARFGINSTIGVGGLIDVAKHKPFNLPWRRNGFALTLGYYGVGPGPYLFVPLVGPTTLRDWAGLGFDRLLLPYSVGGAFDSAWFIYGGFAVRSLDERIALEPRLAEMRAAGKDFYRLRRDSYLAARQLDIDALKGKIPAIAPRP